MKKVDIEKIKVIKNPDGYRCCPACALTILRLFGKRLSFDDVDSFLGVRQKKTYFTLPEICIFLHHNGIKCRYYTKLKGMTYKEFLEIGAVCYSKKISERKRKVEEIRALERCEKYSKEVYKLGLVKEKKIDIHWLRRELKRGRIAIVVVNWNELNNRRSKKYIGHCVIVAEIKGSNVTLIDPDVGIRKISISLFSKAWHDEDGERSAIVVYL